MIANTVLLGFIGGQEVIIILVIVLLLFGGRKIPELMRGLGKGVKEFKNATSGVDEDVKALKKDMGEVAEELNKANPVNELKKK